MRRMKRRARKRRKGCDFVEVSEIVVVLNAAMQSGTRNHPPKSPQEINIHEPAAPMLKRRRERALERRERESEEASTKVNGKGF